MNKIIRIASVFALACAALLYTGCTKDFSGDISRLETKDAELATDIAGVNSALEAYKAAANKAIADNADLIAKKADKTTVAALQEQVDGINGILTASVEELADLEDALEENFETVGVMLVGIAADLADLEEVDADLQDQIDAINIAFTTAQGQVSSQFASVNNSLQELSQAKTAASGEISKLQAALNDVIAMVQSITYVPSHFDITPDTTKVDEIANVYLLTTPDSTYAAASAAPATLVYSQPLVGLTFKVTPASAAKNLTKDNVKLVVSNTKGVATVAEIDTLFTITSVAECDLGKGYVDVYAQAKAAFNAAQVNLYYERTTDNGVMESITNVHPIVIASSAYYSANIDATYPATAALQYFFTDGEDVADGTSAIDLDPVVVYADAPASEVEKEIFTPANLETLACIDGAYYSLEEAAAIFAKDQKFVKPWKGDTAIVYTANALGDFVVTDKGYKTTVKANPDVPTPLNHVDAGTAGASDKQAVALQYNNLQATSAALVSVINGAYQVKPVEDVTTCVASNDLKIDWSWRIAPYAANDSTFVGDVAVTNCDSLLTIPGVQSIVILNDAGDTLDWTGNYRNAAKVDANKIKFSVKGDSTKFTAAEQTFKVVIRNHTPKQIDYVSSFNIVVAKKHADVVINLEEQSSNFLSFAAGITYKNNLIQKLAAEFGVDTATADSAKFVQRVVATWDYAGIKDSCKVTPAAASTDPVIDAGYTIIPAAYLIANGYGKYDLVKLIEAFGIKFEIKQTINVNKPALTLEPIESYLSASNVAGVDYDAQIVGYADAGNGFKYTLQTMPFHQYMFAKGNNTYYKSSAITVKIDTIPGAATGAIIPAAAIGVQAAPNYERFAEGADTVKWGTFNKLEFNIGARLNNPEGVKLDTATIRLWTKDPIPTFTATSIEMTQVFNTATSKSIFGALTVKDFKGETLNTNTGWKPFSATIPDYGQTITLDTDKTHWTCEQIDLALLDVTLTAGGDFTLAANQANLTGDITIEIPAKLTYYLGGAGKTAKIKVVIKKDPNA